MNTGVLTHVVADCISFATTFLCSAAKVISHSFRNTPCRIYALRTGMPACPQSVRLRKLRGGCICPRQRRHAILLLPKPKPHGRCGTRRQLRPSAVRVLILFFQSRDPASAAAEVESERLAAFAIPGPGLSAAARQWRGCGNCGAAYSAPGSAASQFSRCHNKWTLRYKASTFFFE